MRRQDQLLSPGEGLRIYAQCLCGVMFRVPNAAASRDPHKACPTCYKRLIDKQVKTGG